VGKITSSHFPDCGIVGASDSGGIASARGELNEFSEAVSGRWADEDRDGLGRLLSGVDGVDGELFGARDVVLRTWVVVGPFDRFVDAVLGAVRVSLRWGVVGADCAAGIFLMILAVPRRSVGSGGNRFSGVGVR
jgi:hypothetical protein